MQPKAYLVPKELFIFMIKSISLRIVYVMYECINVLSLDLSLYM